MRRQPSGMGTKRGEPVTRQPVSVQSCRGCGVTVTDETIRWDADRSTCVCQCGISDPVGGSR